VKITVESTEKLTRIDGALARVWKGRTERGVECTVFIARIGVERGADSNEFARELEETHPPAEDVFVSLRSIS